MTFNFWTFLFEILNFLVLVYILQRLLYRPLRQAIDERQAYYVAARDEVDRARQEAGELQRKFEAELADAGRQRQELLQDARAQAEAERQRLLADAAEEVRRRQDEVRRGLERDREETLRGLRSEVVGAAVELSKRLLGEAANSSLHLELTRRLLEALEALAPADRERVRASCSPTAEAFLETASDLGTDFPARLSAVLDELVGRKVLVRTHTLPELLSGVRIRLDGHVWDASLAGQLENA